MQSYNISYFLRNLIQKVNSLRIVPCDNCIHSTYVSTFYPILTSYDIVCDGIIFSRTSFEIS